MIEHAVQNYPDPAFMKSANAVYFSPLFESDTHGYNTRDYRKLDVRLGTNEDFKKVCSALHESGIHLNHMSVFYLFRPQKIHQIHRLIHIYTYVSFKTVHVISSFSHLFSPSFYPSSSPSYSLQQYLYHFSCHISTFSGTWY